jgi:hypothetical protein
MALSLVKPSDRPAGLPTFHCNVNVPAPSIWNAGAREWRFFKVQAVSATDACLKAAYQAVRLGLTPHGEPVTVHANGGDHWGDAECTVTPTGRTGGAS